MREAVERRPSRAAPLVTGALGLGYVALVAVRDPAAGGPFLTCPFHLATGLWCPTCGATRGTHQLLRGDVVAALSACAPLALLLPLLAYGWATWLVPSLPGVDRIPRRWWFAAVAALVAYGVARNLPGSALAP